MPNADTSCCVVLNTCPDERTAGTIARALVEAKLAACVNIVPGLRSIYHWEERLQEGTEVLLLIKTTAERYPQVEEFIRARHPYSLAEIVSVPITRGLPGYLEWIAASTAMPGDRR
jgi:periplasmic divalent cation tolerance protein